MEKANNQNFTNNNNSQRETTPCSDIIQNFSSTNNDLRDLFGKKRFVLKKNYSNHNQYELKGPLNEIYVENLLGELQYLQEEKGSLENFKDIKIRISQPLIKSSFRSILLDWMMELCSQLSFKRITFHLAIKLVDLYIWKNIIEPNKLQLLGVTSIFISSKMEEITPKSVIQLAFTTGDAYSKEEILEFEKKMLISFQWKVNFQTCLTWANYISYKWDSWIYFHSQMNHSLKCLPSFRNTSNNLKYSILLNYFYCLDLASLYSESVEYDEKAFPACVFYLIIGLYSNIISYNTLISIASGNMDLSVLNHSGLNNVIDMFLSETVDMQLMDIVTYLGRCCKLLIYVLGNHINQPDESKVINILYLDS